MQATTRILKMHHIEVSLSSCGKTETFNAEIPISAFEKIGELVYENIGCVKCCFLNICINNGFKCVSPQKRRL